MTASYKLTRSGLVVRSHDGASIPEDEGNADWREYQQWFMAGNSPEPFAPAEVSAPSFVARDLIAQLTPDDYAAIKAATARSNALGLLWDSLMAQGDVPIATNSERFLVGWAGLKLALGNERAAAVALTLNIPN